MDGFAAFVWPLIILAVLAAGCATSPSAEDSSRRYVLADSGAAYPTVALDRDGETAYVSWFERTASGGSNVHVAPLNSRDGDAAEPVQVNPADVTVNAHGQAPAQIAVGPDGAVYVAWSTRTPIEGRRFPASDLLLARSIDGGRSFERPIFVNDDAGGEPAGHTFHDMDIGPDGTVYVSWLDSRSGETEVRVAASRDGGRRFNPSVVVASGTCQCCRTSLAISEGVIYVGWRHIFGDNIRDIAVAHSTDGARSFSAPTRVHTDGWAIDGCPHSGPSLTIAGENLHVAWYTAAPQSVGLHYAVSEDRGETFRVERSLETDIPIAQARLATTTPERIWMAWENPRADSLYAAPSYAASPVVRLAGSAPDLAGSSSLAVLTWQDDSSIQALLLPIN